MTPALVRQLARLDEDEQRRVLRGLTWPQRRALAESWAAWAHPGQLAPGGDWSVWLVRAGRGFGKTRAGAEWVSELARATPGIRIALVAATLNEGAAVMVEGASGLIAVARVGEAVEYRRSDRLVRFASGSTAHLYSADSPESLRGPEHHHAWCDELAKWRRGGAAWDNLRFGLRLGERPRVMVTTTPRPTPLMRRILALPGLVETRGGSGDNPHLPDAYLAAMRDSYGASAQGRQEIDGEMIDDVAGALWTRAMLAGCRGAVPEALERVVVGVDPPASAGGDACGIVACGVDADGTAYVIEDASVRGERPEGWARAVADCAGRVGADRVVAERNQGGEMVGSVLAAADAALPVRLVHASRGKVARAEPVAALYERGRVRHAGHFPALEDELCGLVAGGGYEGPGRSPDRADALVWALSELMLRKRAAAGVRVLG